MVRSRTRRGNTLLDLVLSIMLAGAAIAPALSMISSQLETTRWARERVTAMQLARDVLELYTAQGYYWMTEELRQMSPQPRPPFPPACSNGPWWPGQTPWNYYWWNWWWSTTPRSPYPSFPVWPYGPCPPPASTGGTDPQWLRFDRTVGFGGGLTSSLNPILGGPRAGNPGAGGVFDVPLGTDWNAERTFRWVQGFWRRVEIFGGQQYLPPGYEVAQPFPLPGYWPPAFPNRPNCFFVRVTIGTSSQGSLATPETQYQVVTVIGQR